jgi:hypothetical protein
MLGNLIHKGAFSTIFVAMSAITSDTVVFGEVQDPLQLQIEIPDHQHNEGRFSFSARLLVLLLVFLHYGLESTLRATEYFQAEIDIKLCILNLLQPIAPYKLF